MKVAIEWYASAYVKDPANNYWHGINTVACIMRGHRDGIDVASALDPEEIARRTLATISAVKPPGAWQLATAMEACVALDDAEFALAWALKYVKAEGTDAFELGSTLRQLREVWQLTPEREPGASLIPLLEANLLQREGGQVRRSPGEMQSLGAALANINLQVKFGPVEFTKIQWLARGIAQSNLVASIWDRHNNRIGSGFVVRGDALHPTLGTKPILVTNSHVLGGPPPPGKKSVFPQEATVRFENVGSECYFCKDDLILTSPHSELDVSLVALCKDRQLEAITQLQGGNPLVWSAPPPKHDKRPV